jgi:hypothetical protein
VDVILYNIEKMQQYQQQYYQYLQFEIDTINIRDAENKNRAELEKVIPVDPFIDRDTAQFNSKPYYYYFLTDIDPINKVQNVIFCPK